MYHLLPWSATPQEETDLKKCFYQSEQTTTTCCPNEFSDMKCFSQSATVYWCRLMGEWEMKNLIKINWLKNYKAIHETRSVQITI